MENELITHVIGDNKLIITDRATGEPAEYIGLGLDRIIVGVENPERREILTDPVSGYNFSRTAVEAQEIYNSNTQKHGNWFLLQLCTGQYGWFPGCEIRADIIDIGVKMYNAPDDTSEEIYVFNEKSSVTIIDVLNLDQCPDFHLDECPDMRNWRRVIFEREGYVKAAELTNFRYAKPGSAG